MGSTPTAVMTMGFNGFPYFARTLAALSSPIRDASLLTCIALRYSDLLPHRVTTLCAKNGD